jgi:hypothetical protein
VCDCRALWPGVSIPHHKVAVMDLSWSTPTDGCSR